MSHQLRKPFCKNFGNRFSRTSELLRTNFGNRFTPTAGTASNQHRKPVGTKLWSYFGPNSETFSHQLRKQFRNHQLREEVTRGGSGIRKVGSWEGLGARGLSADRRHKLYPTGTRRDAVWRGVGNKFDTLGLPAPVRRNPGPTGVPLKTIEKVWGRFRS